VPQDGRLPRTEDVGGSGLVPLGFEIGLGTSGAPVFDDTGRVAGIALAILAERRSATAGYDVYKDTGIGLMLPSTAFCDDLHRR
jgi:S1-C subfamily serine protease